MVKRQEHGQECMHEGAARDREKVGGRKGGRENERQRQRQRGKG